MNHQELSKRLEAVSRYIPAGSRLADIGSDHGYLPVYLALKGMISYAVAGEVVEGPYLSAKKQVEKDELYDRIHVRLADGLDAIEPSDAINVISICGMGGVLIRDILERGWESQHMTGEERLVLQPNVGEYFVRAWLAEHKYQILQEEILEENQKIYEIIVAEPAAQAVSYSPKELLLGPKLMQEKSSVFQKKWQYERRQREKILQQLKRSETALPEKETLIRKEIKMIQEVLSEDDASKSIH